MANFNCNYISVFRLPYFEYVGGVISFTPKQFQAINGFSNVFFGWGGEDDNLRRRFVTLSRSNELPSRGFRPGPTKTARLYSQI